ncbi:serine hydrolase [Altererythrobacter sp. BO-6]|uniref:serine hydrolase domain-containing protein n=1 Tax=Altererythrobacter sp. BO-6 TaxID=2604537 RepID=UPI0013E1CE86|nr:serine hydrolase [Altererythrobacter sp. BO-6]QIG53615.1 serine hydrolase [Altererythrobacter sp. BO-6]
MIDRVAVSLFAACLTAGCAASYSVPELSSAGQEAPGVAPVSAAGGEAVPGMNVYEVTDTSAYSDEDEAEYLRRFNRLMDDARSGIGLDSYDPLEPVPGAPAATQMPATASPALSAQAIAQAHDYVAARNTSAFLVWKDGALQHEAYFGDFDATTPIVSKSLAKPITALLVGRALMQGHIKSLDQPVADFITEWKGDPEREKIKIRYLLDMRSGLLPQGFSPKPEDMLNRAYLHPRHDEIIINDYPMTHEPGSRYEYSNANSELVSPLIERATGKRYSEYVSEALLEPIGAMGGSVWVNREGGTAHSGCCMLLPAQSWLRMAMLIMNDGVWEGQRLLPEGYVAEMRTGTAQNPYYGLGLWIAGPYIERRGFAHPDVPYGKVEHSEPYLDKDLFLFDGNSNQVVYMIPSQNMIVLRTGARPPNEAPWDNTVLPNMLIRDAAQRAGKPMPEPQPR